MKSSNLLIPGLLAVVLTGCSSPRGGGYSDDPYSPGYGTVVNPATDTSSPSFRPGIRSGDIRDPNVLLPNGNATSP